MKNFIMSIVKSATSKKLLWIVVILFVSASIAMYVLNQLGTDIMPLQQTYDGIKDIFIWEIVIYSGKATVEKTDLVKEKINQVMENIK